MPKQPATPTAPSDSSVINNVTHSAVPQTMITGYAWSMTKQPATTGAGDSRAPALAQWTLTGELTGSLLTEAREWIMDCCWTDLEPEDVEDLPAAVIQRGIRRHYAGGVAQFVADSTP